MESQIMPSNNRGGSRSNNRNRDSEGRFASNSFLDTARERPYATAAVAAGVAAAGAFLWSRRGQISEYAETGMDKLSEIKAERMGSDRSQSDISEEALTLKETGKSRRTPSASPSMQTQSKAGAVSY